jgi:hypothetical protein
MKNLNKNLLSQLKNGEIAIDYTIVKNLDLLRLILKTAFPHDNSPCGDSDLYYSTSGLYWSGWHSNAHSEIPRVTVNDFLVGAESKEINNYEIF